MSFFIPHIIKTCLNSSKHFLFEWALRGTQALTQCLTCSYSGNGMLNMFEPDPNDCTDFLGKHI